ncbi:NAD(P)/FAD-dependent oxidoreductase [Crossiella cryophila]|uniref:Glycine/D-amino acid oxidase-like deaminating enzyme n=1 Tax=Crossiella cryophila TaxID=43355 RepID=A0A7W7CK85_9PSEU|nr:FAD-dependent oxidoreductase [Crossiella cryophila]MBB4681303.1 glycine/D-amino acid oxidase-like deaminating enzyme [Crossiella cryophila]
MSLARTSPWGAGQPVEPALPPLIGRHRADIVVVGGGIAGLSLAHRLRAELPSARIMLLEAVLVGGGATGHSTGLARPGVWGSMRLLHKRVGPAAADALTRASLEGMAALRELVTGEDIDCDLVRGRMYQLPVTAQHVRRYTDDLPEMNRLGMRADWLSAREAAETLGLQGGFGALRVAPLYQLDPLRLCRGLREVLSARGVEVYEGSPVRSIEPGERVRVRTNRGEVDAAQVVLAIDGYTRAAGLVKLPIVPFRSQALCTEPLSAAQLAGLALRPGDLVLDSRAFFNYVRLSPDGRLILGGGRAANPRTSPGTQPPVSAGTWRRLERELRQLFPGLAEVRIARSWAGVSGATPDWMPIVGQVEPGVWFAGGWNGRGIAPALHSAGWLSGQLAAALHGKPLPPPTVPWHRSGARPAPVFDRLRYPLRQTFLQLTDRRSLHTGRCAPLRFGRDGK